MNWPDLTIMFNLHILQSAIPGLLEGAGLTLQLTACVLLLGGLLALPVALLRNARTRVLRFGADAYVLFFRGTPALVQLFLLYYGAGQFDVVRQSPLWPALRDPFWCVVIALGLNSAAYSGKTLAGALAAVPRPLHEASFVLGLSRFQAFWLVKLPLAVRTALPAFGNEIVLTCKATSLASTVTLLELTGRARLLASETYAPFEVFLGAGLIYLALNFLFMHGIRRVESALHSPR